MTSKKELEKGYSGLATTALIMSIVGWLILGIVLEPIALILGIRAMASENSSTKTMATIATVLSSVSLILIFIFFMIAIAAASYR